MSSVGVRELKEHTSEIVRRVRENGETIDITYRGKVVATIAPKRTLDSERDRAFWERVDQLRRDIAAHMGPEPVDAVELVREQRRNLTPDEWVTPDHRFNS